MSDFARIAGSGGQVKPEIVLSKHERALILLLRGMDFWKTNKRHTLIIEWADVCLRVFDTIQIKNGND